MHEKTWLLQDDVFGADVFDNARHMMVDTQVTGDANENQILLSIETYVDAVEFLIQSLNDLFRLAKENACVNQRRALEVQQPCSYMYCMHSV